MTHSQRSTMTKTADSRCRGAGFFAVVLALAILGGTNPAKAGVVATPGRLYDLPDSYCIDDGAPNSAVGSRTGLVIESPSMYMSFYDTSTYSEQTVWWLPAIYTWNDTGWKFLTWGKWDNGDLAWHYGTAHTSSDPWSCLLGGDCSFHPEKSTDWHSFGFGVTPGHYYRAAIYYYWPATIDVDHGTTVQVGSKSARRWVAGPPYCYPTGNGTGITIRPGL